MGQHAGMTSVNKTSKKVIAKKQVGQHPGIIKLKMFEIKKRGWVNITGMVGQHKTEWWVNMLRNLQFVSADWNSGALPSQIPIR